MEKGGKVMRGAKVLAQFDGVAYVEHFTPLEMEGAYLVEVYKYEKGKRLKLSEYAEIDGKRYEVEGYEAPGVLTVRLGVPEECDEVEDIDKVDGFDEVDEVDEISQAAEDYANASIDWLD